MLVCFNVKDGAGDISKSKHHQGINKGTEAGWTQTSPLNLNGRKKKRAKSKLLSLYEYKIQTFSDRQEIGKYIMGIKTTANIPNTHKELLQINKKTSSSCTFSTIHALVHSHGSHSTDRPYPYASWNWSMGFHTLYLPWRPLTSMSQRFKA